MRDAPRLFSVLWGLSAFYWVRAEYGISFELGRQTLALAQRQQDPVLMMGAHLELGSSLFSLGEFSQTCEHLEQGLALYDPQKHRGHAFIHGQDFGIACLSRLSGVLWFLGYPDQSFQQSQEALAIAQGPHLFSLAYALSFAAELHRLRGEEDKAKDLAEKVLTLSAQQAFPLWQAGATIIDGWALAMQGQAEEGVRQIECGLEAWQVTGARAARPQFLGLLAEAYEKGGKIEKGLATLAEGLAAVEESGERWWEAELYRLTGELLLAQEKKKQKAEIEVEQYFQTALDIAHHQNAKSLELRAAMSLGRLWKRQGKRTEALQLLEKAYGWFTEGFGTKDLREAKELLEEFSRSGERFFLDRK